MLQRRAARLAIWHWYWVDGHATASAYTAKIRVALAKLRGAGDDSAIVVVFTPDESKPEAASVLKEFVSDMGPEIERALVSTQAAEH